MLTLTIVFIQEFYIFPLVNAASMVFCMRGAMPIRSCTVRCTVCNYDKIAILS